MASVWSSSINIHARNAPNTHLIYTSAFLFSQSRGKGSCANEEPVYWRRGWFCFAWLCLIKQAKRMKSVCSHFLCPAHDPSAARLGSWPVSGARGAALGFLCKLLIAPGTASPGREFNNSLSTSKFNFLPLSPTMCPSKPTPRSEVDERSGSRWANRPAQSF